MELVLKRTAKRSGYTIGHLYNRMPDGSMTMLCDTLEDEWRDLNHGAKKVYGETCIPDGIYEVSMSVRSPKYWNAIQSKGGAHPLAFTEGIIPRLLHVPYFDGILIHTGNTAKDSYGCILVGENKVKGGLVNSTATFRKLYTLMKEASGRREKITISIS